MDNPVVLDSADGTQATGDRIVLKRGERKAYIMPMETPEPTTNPENAMTPHARPTVILPPMNFDNFKKPADKAGTPATTGQQ
jgi:hypothetical protein